MQSPPSSNSWQGRFIGDNQRYRLDKRLGGGGMGEVFLATDTRVGHKVALKLLKDTLVASAEMRKRFEREVAVCAALQSDHIVKISDCGVTSEGYPFYVMEYLRGQTLRQLLLREKRLSVERTASIITQVCKTLHVAHQGVILQRDGGQSNEHIQVIHRDLKPDNIFLVPTDLGEWVKILDFGVAKIRSESEHTSLTITFIGTFRYAAPEQIKSDKNIDGRADIYSLGIILYEMLSATDPFGLCVKPNNISEASWVLAHAYEPPKPLRSQPGCEHLSSELEAVVLKCLQKNPQNRFATVEELDQALQAAVEYEQSIVTSQTLDKIVAYEITPRPLTPIEQGELEETIPPVQTLSNQETIGRSLQPIAQCQPEDETILRPQPLHNQGSNHETIPRPLNPVEQSQPEDETIIRPLNPVEQSQPEGTLMQPRPLQNQGSNHETIPRPLQAHPVPNQSNNQNLVATSPLNYAEVSNADGTLYQPRPIHHPSEQPAADGTLYQPRAIHHPSEQPAVEGKIFQQRKNGQQARKLPQHFWQILGVVLTVGLTLVVVAYLYPQWQSGNNSNDQKNLPKLYHVW
ncbi:MAG: protein kinase [Mojavia pulchra JT2-VF2]|jgi:serine/threonine-protein kinase|uniref:Protein kinase n=1 Tax=Mojavia pulchra JT2-VF2 TaxID=287848 RepID=A0A951Q3S7_9NOST|nr:protein kinase [Mojavia pulchra JT2-VF2]